MKTLETWKTLAGARMTAAVTLTVALLASSGGILNAESPGSETFEVQDIAAIAAAAHARGACLILDNTWATPLQFRAFESRRAWPRLSPEELRTPTRRPAMPGEGGGATPVECQNVSSWPRRQGPTCRPNRSVVEEACSQRRCLAQSL